MKKIVLISVFSISLFAQELSLLHNYKAALQKAKQEHKHVMMLYSATWCPECNYMKEVVFKDKNVASYLQSNYVVVSLDIDKDNLPKGFDYNGIPTFFFTTANGEKIATIEGGNKANKFLTQLKEIR